MISRARSHLPATVLMAYLSTVISGGLHHHDSVAPPGSAAPSFDTCKCDISSLTNPNHEESDECSVCIALQQAKSSPVLIYLSETFVPVGEAVSIPFMTTCPAFPLVQQARAPPGA
jgi:hypothetical protein